MTDKLATALILFSFVSICALSAYNRKPLKVETFDRPYTFTIQDEHSIVCVAGKDTVILFFENSYVLADQNPIVFITH